jgi:hypothetical protein
VLVLLENFGFSMTRGAINRQAGLQAKALIPVLEDVESVDSMGYRYYR